MQNDLPQFEPWLRILHKNVKFCFSEKLWTGRSEFAVGQFTRFAYSCEKSSQVAGIT